MITNIKTNLMLQIEAAANDLLEFKATNIFPKNNVFVEPKNILPTENNGEIDSGVKSLTYHTPCVKLSTPNEVYFTLDEIRTVILKYRGHYIRSQHWTEDMYQSPKLQGKVDGYNLLVELETFNLPIFKKNLGPLSIYLDVVANPSRYTDKTAINVILDLEPRYDPERYLNIDSKGIKFASYAETSRELENFKNRVLSKFTYTS